MAVPAPKKKPKRAQKTPARASRGTPKTPARSARSVPRRKPQAKRTTARVTPARVTPARAAASRAMDAARRAARTRAPSRSPARAREEELGQGAFEDEDEPAEVAEDEGEDVEPQPPDEEPAIAPAIGAALGPPGSADDLARPPVVPVVGNDEPFAAPPPEPPAQPGPYVERGPERPLDEGLIGIAAAALAFSTFLPWYSRGFGAGVSGYASGTWGPIIFFLAVAAVAIVGLRLARASVSFPLGSPLILEGIGWVAVVGMLIKRWVEPGGLSPSGGQWVALGAAFGVALLAGRVSKDTPIVFLPGWYRGGAGRLGALLLTAALGAGIWQGLTNSAQEALFGGAVPGPTGGPPNQVQGLPGCAKDVSFPVPKGVVAKTGFETEGTLQNCTITLESSVSLVKTYARYRAALKGAGWRFDVPPTPAQQTGQQTTRILTLTEPQCGALSMGRQPATSTGGKGAGGTVFVVAYFAPCRAPGSIPSP